MSRANWAHIAMLTATLLYGANYRIAKAIMPFPMPPFAFIMFRILGAGLLFWLLHALYYARAARLSKNLLTRHIFCTYYESS